MDFKGVKTEYDFVKWLGNKIASGISKIIKKLDER